MSEKKHNFSVTILISVYNQASSLDECFKSVHNQFFQDFKIVCINDGSTDSTAQVIEKWKNIFGKDRFILNNNKYNCGLTGSLNIGLSMIDTPYTARIDADDIWQKEKLEKQIIFLKNNPHYGIIGCGYINKGKSKSLIINPPQSDQQIRKFILRRNPFAHSCIVFKTDLVKSLGGYNESCQFGQDYELWLRCLKLTKFHNLPEILCTRIAFGKTYKKMKAHYLFNLKLRLKFIREQNISKKYYIYLFFDFILFYFILIFWRNKKV